jgi:leader peptidase (prepilin peptidase)/N-methyltransferase
LPEVPNVLWGTTAFICGAVIGSFLNVVIWRLPRGESLLTPGSHCPHCHRPLAAYENIPLLSFLILRARCRTCKAPISWRYFFVELLTATLFTVITLHFGPTADTVAYCLFGAALLAAFFIDFEHFIIPDEVNTLALLVGIGRDVWGILQREPEHTLLWGWVPRSLLGGVLCAAIFVGIQILGLALFRKDAMGDGDVKLARAIGAMLPMKLALVSFLLAIGAGAVLGGSMVLWHSLRTKQAMEPAILASEDAIPPQTTASPLGAVLFYGLLYVSFLDLLLWLGALLRLPWVSRIFRTEAEAHEEEFLTGPTHIPFGPYMVLGALLSLFFGEALIRWYLEWANLVPHAGM